MGKYGYANKFGDLNVIKVALKLDYQHSGGLIKTLLIEENLLCDPTL